METWFVETKPPQGPSHTVLIHLYSGALLLEKWMPCCWPEKQDGVLHGWGNPVYHRLKKKNLVWIWTDILEKLFWKLNCGYFFSGSSSLETHFILMAFQLFAFLTIYIYYTRMSIYSHILYSQGQRMPRCICGKSVWGTRPLSLFPDVPGTLHRPPLRQQHIPASHKCDSDYKNLTSNRVG